MISVLVLVQGTRTQRWLRLQSPSMTLRLCPAARQLQPQARVALAGGSFKGAEGEGGVTVAMLERHLRAQSLGACSERF